MPTAPHRHYALTTTMNVLPSGVILRRIVALRDIPIHGVKAGDRGGWVQHYNNLAGMAWVADNAIVMGDAWVTDCSLVQGNALIRTGARLRDNARVQGFAIVENGATIRDDSTIGGHAVIGDKSLVRGTSLITGDANVTERNHIAGDANITERNHIHTIHNVGSENVTLTLYRTKTAPFHALDVGCWSGDLSTLMGEVVRRKQDWSASPEEVERWVKQYRELEERGRTIVASWGQ